MIDDGQATCRTDNESVRRDVLENDKPSFQLTEKLFTPSEFTLDNDVQLQDSAFDETVAASIDDCEVIASSHDTDILANLLDGKRDNLNTAFDSWVAKLLDNGTGQKDIWSEKIKESLGKQLQDGLLSYYEYIDLEYVGRVWTGLLSKLNTYNLGSTCNKKDIFTLLLELYDLKQISKELFVESMLQFII